MIIALVALGLLLAFFHRGDDTSVVQPKGDCATCDGTPEHRCEQDCMMEAATHEIEYFDDEELDAFKGRRSDSYTDEEAECFRDVLTTMMADEVPAWGRSLCLRGIELPDQVKEEFVMMVGG
jgi:hypothetical protein